MERKVRDSCGSSGTGETPQERQRRGGSPPTPRKASTWSGNQLYQTKLLLIKQPYLSRYHNILGNNPINSKIIL
ncbi:hypothetical protein E0Y62_14790 [Cytobacillus praedii]|uniref:Uncharacterized protein n=1 Tax=Cytobacillus praedii TaxID=1742358 RepID=A0A4R1ATI4_9BACI|nr:hypothetical protein E0Y62_14790 [Cytobacillus praedii]